MEIIIEELSRGHKLLGRHKFLQDSVNIGRGYNNDIIVTDPHVCPEHISIKYDGEHWVVYDEQSLNGSYIEGSKQLANNHVVQSGDVICFGASQIRLVFPNHPVEASVPFSAFENFINISRNPISLTISIVLFSMVAGWIFYLNKPVEVNFSQVLVPAIGMTLMFALWPAMVALISHLTKHDARVLTQLGVCFVFFNLMWISDVFETIVSFNTSSNLPVSLLIAVIPIALAFCLFWLNCYIGFHMSKVRRIVTASCITALLFGGSALVQLSNKPEFNPRPNYNSTLMMPSFFWATSSDVDTFIEDSAKLFTKTQKAAEKDKLKDKK